MEDYFLFMFVIPVIAAMESILCYNRQNLTMDICCTFYSSFHIVSPMCFSINKKITKQ